MNTNAIQGNAFIVDARTTVRAMTPDTIAVTPDDFGAYFDTVAYDKCEFKNSCGFFLRFIFILSI